MGFLEIKIATCILDWCVGWLIVFRNSFQMLCEVLILSKESFFDGLQQKKSLGSFDGKKGKKKEKVPFFSFFLCLHCTMAVFQRIFFIANLLTGWCFFLAHWQFFKIIHLFLWWQKKGRKKGKSFFLFFLCLHCTMVVFQRILFIAFTVFRFSLDCTMIVFDRIFARQREE